MSIDNQSLSVDEGRIVVRNTLWNLMGRMVPIFAAFFLVPYILNRIGKEAFGVWTLSFILTNYTGLLDLGFGAGLTKFVAEYLALKDHRKLLEHINTGYILYLLFNLLLILFMWTIIPEVVSFMKISLELRSDSIYVIRGSFIAFLFLNFLMVNNSILNGTQRMDLTNTISMVNAVLTVVGTLFVLEIGLGLKGLILNSIIVAICSSLLALFINFRMIPNFALSPSYFSIKAFKNLGLYGIKMYVSNIAGMVVTQFDKILTGYFLSMTYLAFYQVGSRAKDFILSFPMAGVAAVLPTASKLDTLKQLETLRDLHERVSKYFFAASAPLIIAILFFGDIMIYLWMGKGFEDSVIILQVLSIAYLFNLIVTGSGTGIVRGIGKPEELIPYSLLAMVTSIVFGVLGGLKFGLYGILGATLCASLFSSCYFYLRLYKLMSWDYLRLIIIWRKGIVCMILTLIPVSISAPYLNIILFNNHRFISVFIFIIYFIILCFLYIIISIIMRYFDEQDLKILKVYDYIIKHKMLIRLIERWR